MYRLEFEGNTLYIFRTLNEVFQNRSGWSNQTLPPWQDVTGTANAVNLRFDALDKEEAFTEIIKHSLEITLIREDEADFIDIITGNDSEWFACVLRGGRLISSSVEGYPIIEKTGTSDARLLFFGTLTNETYGETFMHLAEVSLTFHDKIGALKELNYEPLTPTVNMATMLADLLSSAICAKTLLAEWRYSFQDYGQAGDRLDQFNLNVSEWIGKSKFDVLKQFLGDHKLQLAIDYEVSYGASYGANRKLFDSGAIRLKCVAQHYKPIGEYNVYRLTSTIVNNTKVYNYVVQEGEGITTERTYSQFQIIYNQLSPPQLGLPSIIIAFEQKGNRYYSVVRGSFTPVLNQSQLESIGCVFPCVVDQFEYNAFLSIISFTSSLVNLFSFHLGWHVFISMIGYGIFRSNLADVDEDITLTYANPLIVSYTDVTDYVENSTMVSYTFSEGKTRYVLGSDQNPIIERAASYQLARKAKHLTADVTFKVSDELIFPKELDIENCESVGFDLRYNYARQLYGLLFSDVVNYIKGIPLAVGGNAAKPLAINYNGTDIVLKMAAEALPSTRKSIVMAPISMIKSDTNLIVEINGGANLYIGDIDVFACVCAYINNTLYHYSAANATWIAAGGTDYSQSIYATFDQTARTFNINGEIPQPQQVATDEPYQLCLVTVINYPIGGNDYYLKSASLKYKTTPVLPRKLTLKTILNASMRTPVEFKSEFCTLPDIEGAMGFYRNGLMTSTGYPIHTLYYGGLEQTLLAHASDQFGYNYSKDRWIAQIKTIVDGVRLFNLYELDFRVMMLISGTYDVRRNKLTGSFVEIAQLDRLDGWLWDDDEILVWEDGDRILI